VEVLRDHAWLVSCELAMLSELGMGGDQDDRIRNVTSEANREDSEQEIKDHASEGVEQLYLFGGVTACSG
jgi:hypothetical protein